MSELCNVSVQVVCLHYGSGLSDPLILCCEFAFLSEIVQFVHAPPYYGHSQESLSDSWILLFFCLYFPEKL